MFSCKFWEIFRDSFLSEHLQGTTSESCESNCLEIIQGINYLILICINVFLLVACFCFFLAALRKIGDLQSHLGIPHGFQLCLRQQINSIKFVKFNSMFNPVGIYMFKINSRNTRTRCEICLKTPERHHWRDWKHWKPDLQIGNTENLICRLKTLKNWSADWKHWKFDLQIENTENLIWRLKKLKTWSAVWKHWKIPASEIFI